MRRSNTQAIMSRSIAQANHTASVVAIVFRDAFHQLHQWRIYWQAFSHFLSSAACITTAVRFSSYGSGTGVTPTAGREAELGR
jgi:hypothetical protein